MELPLRHPPDHDPAADPARARPLLSAARRGRLDARRHRHRPPRRAGDLGRFARRRRGRADLRHPLPPRPRRRGGRRRRADARAGHQGELDYAQCELVWGNPKWPERIAEWFLTHGVPSEITEELIGSGERLPAVHPLSARPGARRRRRPARRLGARGGARPRRRPALPVQGPGARLGRPPARPDLADGRALAGEPPRSARATTSSRWSGRSSSSRRSRCRGTATRSPTPSAAPAS